MSDEAKPKRRGRPPKREGERKAGNLTIRTYGDLRESLEEAARISGRSVSGEVEFRLEQSFRDAQVVYESSIEAINRAVDVTLGRVYNESGGFTFHEASQNFGRILKYKLSEVEIELGKDTEWFRDQSKIDLLKDKMLFSPSIIIDAMAETTKRRNTPLTSEQKEAILQEIDRKIQDKDKPKGD